MKNRTELINLFNENPNIELNYADSRKNNALRKFLYFVVSF